jgi:putative ABC transport system permease protein
MVSPPLSMTLRLPATLIRPPPASSAANGGPGHPLIRCNHRLNDGCAADLLSPMMTVSAFGRIMIGFLNELRLAVRSLVQRPTYAGVAVATLGLGIAVAATMFGIVDAVLLEPLKYDRPGDLVSISGRLTVGGEAPLSVPEYLDLRQRLTPRIFSAVSMSFPVTGNLAGTDEPEKIASRGVTGDFFSMLNVAPEAGRVFAPSEETPGITPIAVISDDLWHRRFGGLPSAIGRHLLIDDDDYTIAGVMPRGFEHPGVTRAEPVDLWFLAGFRGTPFPPPARAARSPGTTVTARLQRGVSLGEAQAALDQLRSNWLATYPADYGRAKGFAMSAVSLERSLIQPSTRQGLLLLSAAVGLVLMIACTNVAALQLMRRASLAGELATRRALGASSAQIARQPFAESVVLGAGGGVVGVAAAWFVAGLTRANLPASLPHAAAVAVDTRVLVASLAASVGLMVVFGALPAFLSQSGDLASVLRASARASGIRGGTRERLVIGEIALAVMLLTATGLLLRSYSRLLGVRTGFDASGLLTLQLRVAYPNDPTLGRYVPTAPRAQYFARILARLRESPGVVGAAIVGNMPFGGAPIPISPFSAEGQSPPDPTDLPRAQLDAASPDLFRVMRVPMLAGREFSIGDTTGSAGVVIVNETLARQMWPRGSAINKQIKLGPPAAPTPWVTVVGVVRDTHTQSLEGPVLPQLYFPYQQVPPFTIGFIVRTKGNPRLVREALAAQIRAIDPNQPVFDVHTMPERLAADVAQRRAAVFATGLFALLALTLAGIGVYGTAAFMVVQRTPELGVRIALGASPARAVGLVLGHGVRLALAGATIGIVGSVIGVRWLASMLYGIGPYDPVALLAFPLVIFGVAVLATWVPARRAAAIDPVIAMRSE